MLPEDLLSQNVVETTLRNDQGERVKLLSFKHENCTKKGENFFNVLKRVNVTYEKDGHQHEISYVAKVNPCKPNDSFNPYRRRAMLKEIFFYTDLLHVLNSELSKMNEENLKVPKYLSSFMDEDKEVIMFEDLRLKGFQTFSKTENMDEAHSIIMAKEISRLHAASFSLQTKLGMANIEQIYPLLTESWIAGDFKLREAFENIFIKGLEHNISLTKALEEFQDLIPWMQGLRNEAMETLLKELQPISPWKGICHGDFHRTNVLFRYNELHVPQEVMIIDWQTVRIAHPSSEISYLLFSSFFGPPRDQFFPIITQTYFETYSKAIGSDPFFRKEEFEDKVKNNQFGLLICFYLVPLSLCVNDPSEMFKLNENEGALLTESDEAINSAREMLKNKKDLAFRMSDYLRTIHDSALWKKT